MTSNPSPVYEAQYFEAVDLMKQDQLEQCVEMAEYNLKHPNLSRYWCCQNLILICSTTDDWYKAERCRRKAENIWREMRDLEGESGVGAQTTLPQLRRGLDQVETNLAIQFPNDFSESYVYEGVEDDPEWVDEMRVRWHIEDTYTVHCAEEEGFGSSEDITRRCHEVAAASREARLAREAKGKKEAEEIHQREKAGVDAAFAAADAWVQAKEEKAAEKARAEEERIEAEKEAVRTQAQAEDEKEKIEAEDAAAEAKATEGDQKVAEARSKPETPNTRGSLRRRREETLSIRSRDGLPGYLAPTSTSKQRDRALTEPEVMTVVSARAGPRER